MSDDYFYFRETILLLTLTKPEVIKPFPRSTQPSTTLIMLTNFNPYYHDKHITGQLESKRSIYFSTETVLLSTHNTSIRHALFSGCLAKNLMICFGRFRVPDNYFYFRETILLLTQTRPEVIKPFTTPYPTEHKIDHA